MPRTWKDLLTGEEIEALDALRLETRSAPVFRNGTIILMSDAGRSKTSIAEELGCSARTVRRDLRRLEAKGYIGTNRTPSGQQITVLNQRKFPTRATAAAVQDQPEPEPTIYRGARRVDKSGRSPRTNLASRSAISGRCNSKDPEVTPEAKINPAHFTTTDHHDALRRESAGEHLTVKDVIVLEVLGRNRPADEPASRREE